MSSRLTPYGALLRSTVLAGVAAAALAGCGMMGRSDTARFGGTLNGASEVPPNMARGSGMAEAWLDKKSNVLKWKVTYSGLSGPATAGHFHGPASAGANAGPVVAFKDVSSSPIEGQTTLTASQAADLMAGKWYANIHTAANPGGEIRGQMLPM